MRAAAGKCRECHHDADRAAAGNDGGIAGGNPGAGRGLHADCKGLDHRAFGKGDIVGQLVGEACRMHRLRAEHAMHRGRCPKGDGGIDIVEAEAGGARLRIGNPGLHANAVTGLQMGDIGANFGDRSSRLMAQHHGFVDDEIADAAMGIIMHIATADADRVDTDADVVRAHLLRQINVTQREFADTLEDKCFH